MKTYEGTFTVKWHKNDRGSTRPITIDCESRDEMLTICKAVERKFLEKGEDPQAYKSMDEIKSAIIDTVDIIGTIKPVYNFKAAE